MINMSTIECNRDVSCPSGKFTTVWNKTKKRFGLNDGASVMDMDEDLCNIKLNKWKDPKTLLDEIAALKVQCGCALLEDKNAAVLVHINKFNYATVMTVTGTTIRGK